MQPASPWETAAWLDTLDSDSIRKVNLYHSPWHMILILLPQTLRFETGIVHGHPRCVQDKLDIILTNAVDSLLIAVHVYLKPVGHQERQATKSTTCWSKTYDGLDRWPVYIYRPGAPDRHSRHSDWFKLAEEWLDCVMFRKLAFSLLMSFRLLRATPVFRKAYPRFALIAARIILYTSMTIGINA